MNRLTKRIGNIVTFTKGQYEFTTSGEMRSSDIRVCLGKLAEYEDIGLEPKEIIEALKINKGGIYQLPTVFGKEFEHIKELVDLEEQGRLIKLPCKVGDTVYIVHGIEGKVVEREYNLFFEVFEFKCGEDYYLTREEAEAKLREVQNG